MNLISGSVEPGFNPKLESLSIGAECAPCGSKREIEVVNSIGFDVTDADAFVRTCLDYVRCGASHVVHFLAVHPTVVARDAPAYSRLLNSADMVVPDGAPIAAVMRLRGRRAERLTSTDGFLRLCTDPRSHQLRHYFVGGATPERVQMLLSRLEHLAPRLVIAGAVAPPFRPYTDSELATLVAAIRESCTDVVWVGLGAPKQELLAHRLRSSNAAPVIATIGATFDFVAGTKRRAPRWVRALGCEWLFRFLQEPRRLWRRYLVGNARFVARVAFDQAGSVLHHRRLDRG